LPFGCRLVHVDLAANDLVASALVAREVDAPDEVPLVLFHGEGDVHDPALGVRLLPRRPRPLEVADGAVEVAELVEALLEPPFVVDVTRLDLEEGPDERFLEDGETFELHFSHAVLRPLGDRDVEGHPLHRLLLEEPRLAVRVADPRLSHLDLDVPVVEVEVLEPSLLSARVVFPARPLAFGIRGLAAEPAQVPEARGLDLLHVMSQRAARERVVAVEGDGLDLDLGPFVDHERHLLPRSPDGLGLVGDLGEGPALVVEHLLDHAFDPSRLRGVVEGVDLQGHVALLELVLDLGVGEALAPSVVDDLDALPLADPEGNDLACRPVARLDLQIVEEPGVPQAPKVVAQPALVVQVARLRGHVEQQGVLLEKLCVQDLDDLHARRVFVGSRRPCGRPRQGSADDKAHDGLRSSGHR
jgi:hypothetical protein